MPVSEAFTDPASRIERVMAAQDRRFQRVFLDAVRALKRTDLDTLADLLQQGRFEEALEGLEDAARALGTQYGASLAASAQDTARFLSGAMDVVIAFDQTNERAVNMMRQNQLRLVREFANETREVTRNALIDGVSRGLNPREQARNFRDSIGLTRYQESIVSNYRRALTAGRNGTPSTDALQRMLRDGRSDRLVQRMIREGEQLSPAQIDAMVRRYRSRWIKYRSEVIGRTEALRSVHQGNEEMYQQAIESGQFRPDQITRTWVTSRDSRVRDTHSAVGGQVQPEGTPFDVGGAALMYPGDPNGPPKETIQCRCSVTRRIVPPSENRNIF